MAILVKTIKKFLYFYYLNYLNTWNLSLTNLKTPGQYLILNRRSWFLVGHMIKEEIDIVLMLIYIKHTWCFVFSSISPDRTRVCHRAVVVQEKIQVIRFVVEDHCVQPFNRIVLSKRNASSEVRNTFLNQVTNIVVIFKECNLCTTLYNNVRLNLSLQCICDFEHDLVKSIFESIPMTRLQLHKQMIVWLCACRVHFFHHNIGPFFLSLYQSFREWWFIRAHGTLSSAWWKPKNRHDVRSM